jgi:spore coat protein U-like protein
MSAPSRRLVAVLAASAAMAMASGAANAQNCSVAISGALAFGVYALVTPADGATTLTVACQRINQAPNRTVNYAVKLTSGPGTFVNRLMNHLTQPGETLSYNLYRDAARSVVWGDGTSGTTFPTGQFVFNPPSFGNNQQAQFTVYGRIPANQNVAAGNYQTASPITVIVEY